MRLKPLLKLRFSVGGETQHFPLILTLRFRFAKMTLTDNRESTAQRWMKTCQWHIGYKTSYTSICSVLPNYFANVKICVLSNRAVHRSVTDDFRQFGHWLILSLGKMNTEHCPIKGETDGSVIDFSRSVTAIHYCCCMVVLLLSLEGKRRPKWFVKGEERTRRKRREESKGEEKSAGSGWICFA